MIRRIPSATVLVAVAMFAAMLLAQQPAAKQPGRIQLTFNGLAQRAAEVSDVTLDGAMLQVGIRMLSAKDDDAQVRALLQRLQGVYVKSFHFDGRGEYSPRDLAAIRQQLHAPGWSRIMSVDNHDADRSVAVYVMVTAHGPAGMVIIAAYPRELRVVNLVGPIDPAALSRLGGHFGIPGVLAKAGRAAQPRWGPRQQMRRQQ